MESYEEEVAEEQEKPSRYVCAKDVAEAEFERWAEAMGLMSKFDPELLSEEEVKDLKSAKRPVIAAIMEGRLSVNKAGIFAFKPWDVGEDAKLGVLLFKEPQLLDIRDATKEDNKVDSQALLMSKMTGKHKISLLKMQQRNSTVCNSIVGLFLG